MMQALSIAWYERGLRPRVASAAVAALASIIGIALAYRAPNPSWTGAFAALAIVGVAGWMLTAAKTHVTLAVLMIYLACADGVIKLMTNSSSATLGRDLLLYAIATGVVFKKAIRKEQFSAPPLTGWIVAFAATVAVQIFNPADISTSHSLASTRPHLEFVPLFFLGYSVMRTPGRIKGFLMILLAVTAVNGAVGVVQYRLSPDQLASWGPGYAQRINGNGVSKRVFTDNSGQAHTRPFGLGSDEGFGGLLGLIAAPAGFAILMLAGNWKLKIAAGVLSAGVLLAIVTSQARVAIVGTVVAILAFMLLVTSSRRAFRVLFGLAIGLSIAYVAISALTANTSSNLLDRYSSIAPSKVLSTSYSYRATTFAEVLPRYLVKFPLGAGIGKVGPASGSAGGAGPSGLDAESEPTFLLIELGIPGLLVLLAFQVRVLVMSVGVRKLKNFQMRLLLGALAAPIFALFIVGWDAPTTATTPGAPYFWFVAGTLAYWLIGSRRSPRNARPAG